MEKIIFIKTYYSKNEILRQAIINFLNSKDAEPFLNRFPYASFLKIYKFFLIKKTAGEIDTFCKIFAKEMYLKNVSLKITNNSSEKELAKKIIETILNNEITRKQLKDNKIIAFNFERLSCLNINFNKLQFYIEKFGLKTYFLFKSNFGIQRKHLEECQISNNL